MRAYREDVAHAIAWLSHGTCREHASTRTIELTEAILPHTTCHILFLPPSFIRPQGVLSIHVHRQIRSFVCSNASYARPWQRNNATYAVPRGRARQQRRGELRRFDGSKRRRRWRQGMGSKLLIRASVHCAESHVFAHAVDTCRCTHRYAVSNVAVHSRCVERL